MKILTKFELIFLDRVDVFQIGPKLLECKSSDDPKPSTVISTIILNPNQLHMFPK